MVAPIFLWLGWLSWASDFARVLAAESSDNSLKCSFIVDQLEFDICPLLEAKNAAFDITVDEETPPTHTQYRYSVGFRGDLARDGTLPIGLQCPEGTRICLTVINTRPDHPSEPSRILQVVPVAKTTGLNPKAIPGKKDTNDLHAPLQVTFHGGLYMDLPQKATFQFHCDPNAKSSAPSFLWKFNGTHAFSWKTKHACHKPLTKPQPSDPEPDSDPPQDPPEDPESENNVTIPPSRMHSPFMLWIGLSLVILILIFALLSIRTDRNYNRIFSPKRFQSQLQRPIRLLPWLQLPRREASMGDRDETGSELFEARYYDDNRNGEEMPLTSYSKGFVYGKLGTGQYGSLEVN